MTESEVLLFVSNHVIEKYSLLEVVRCGFRAKGTARPEIEQPRAMRFTNKSRGKGTPAPISNKRARTIYFENTRSLINLNQQENRDVFNKIHVSVALVENKFNSKK